MVNSSEDVVQLACRGAGQAGARSGREQSCRNRRLVEPPSQIDERLYAAAVTVHIFHDSSIH
jgi:hypothetical protein